MKKQILILLMLLVGLRAGAQEYKTVRDISFTTKSDAYAQERLKLDVYYPEGGKDCPVVVWFQARMMKLVGHKKTYLYELDGHDHGAMVAPSFHILDAHIKQLLEEQKNK